MMFDTSNLTIIFMGAFEPIYNKKIKESKPSIGFNSNFEETDKRKVIITKDDLIKGGLPPQFLGRIGNVTSTNFFTIEELEQILTKSGISPLLIQKDYFKDSLGVDLRYTKGYVNGIATRANGTGTNARELKALVNESINCAFDEIIDRPDAKVLTLTKKAALDNKNYKIN